MPDPVPHLDAPPPGAPPPPPPPPPPSVAGSSAPEGAAGAPVRPPPPPGAGPIAAGAPPDRPPGDAGDGDFDVVWSRPQRWRRVVAGVAAVLVVALLAWTVVGDGGRRERPRGEDASSGAEPEPVPTTPPEPATPAETEAVVAEISDFVAREQGLAFLEPVDVELLGEGDFQDRLLADFDEDLDDLRREEHLFKALGLVPPDVDLVEAMRSLLGAGVVGFYDPETGELVVRGASVTPYVRTTIAHELTHALDDQHHDLDRPEYDESVDEVGFGFGALVEGNARRVESAYLESLPAAEQQQATTEELTLGAGIDIDRVPLVLLQVMAAPYELGQVLVDDVVAEGGSQALATAFADPPTTSEQVIDPAAYQAREARVDVPHPQVPGQLVDEGVLGQFLIDVLLGSAIGRSDARDAADGWGGDWAVVWTDGSRSCVTLTVVGDDVEETEELARGFDEWAAGQEGVTISPGRGGPLTVESCTG